MKAPQKSLKAWTAQKWRTKSGKPSSKTGGRRAGNETDQTCRATGSITQV